MEDGDDVVVEIPKGPGEPRPPPAAARADFRFDGIGYRLRYDPDYVAPGGVEFSANWQIKCNNPLRKNCVKKRRVSARSTKDRGDIEPLAFLHSWAEMDAPPGTRHFLVNPNQDVVIAYTAAYGDELRDVLARRPV